MSERDRSGRAIAGLRVSLAILLVVHGVARIALGIVDDFGVFLDGAGLPMGVTLAWAVTLFEVLGGLTFALGKGVRTIAVVFSLELALGIAMVHWREGWFVVGAGRNGMEYSVLLIVGLVVVAYGSPRRTPDL